MWKSQTLLQGVFTVPWGPRGHPVTVFTILPATRCHFFFILREVLYYTLWRVAKKVGIGVGDSSDETPYITLPPVFFICLLQRSEHFFFYIFWLPHERELEKVWQDFWFAFWAFTNSFLPPIFGFFCYFRRPWNWISRKFWQDKQFFFNFSTFFSLAWFWISLRSLFFIYIFCWRIFFGINSC